MHPILFKIGDFALYSYGAMLFVAFSVGMFLTLREAPLEEFNLEHIYEAFILSIILAVLGSRLAFVIFNWELFRGGPWWRIFAFREGGLIFYGGLLAALTGVYLYCRYRKVSFLRALDLASPFIALGYAITRIGCFLNGCCYGKVTEVPWGVIFPAVDGLKRHPTQLYASASALLIFILLRHLKKYRTFDGFVFLLFILFYGIYRFLVEFFRAGETALGILTQAQIISLALIVTAGVIFILQKGKADLHRNKL
jgi:phosphatidylglycerol:prolipoprotein diacylglycerol transferase